MISITAVVAEWRHMPSNSPSKEEEYNMHSRWRKMLLLSCTILLLTGLNGPTWAGFVTFGVDDLGVGTFQYNLHINNFVEFNLGEPISGLNILNGNSVFGLDDFSMIDAPIDWSFFAPFPPFVDELNYFSLAPTADVAIGDSLGGFSFQSMTDPNALSGNDFLIEVVLASGVQGPQEVAQTPEPTSLTLIALGLAGLGFAKRRREHT